MANDLLAHVRRALAIPEHIDLTSVRRLIAQLPPRRVQLALMAALCDLELDQFRVEARKRSK